MTTNTKTPQPCCTGCRWNKVDRVSKEIPVTEGTFKVDVRTYSCSLRLRGMFTPDCAFSPERELDRKYVAEYHSARELYTFHKCLTYP